MDRAKYHKYMYTTAAIWNWILAVTFIVLPRIDIEYFLISGMPSPPTLLWFDAFMGFVFVWGIGFYIVSLSTKENHGIIMIGIIEKTYVFIVGFAYFLLAQASIWLVIIVAGDLIFAMLFLEDLLKIRKM